MWTYIKQQSTSVMFCTRTFRCRIREAMQNIAKSEQPNFDQDWAEQGVASTVIARLQ